MYNSIIGQLSCKKNIKESHCDGNIRKIMEPSMDA